MQTKPLKLVYILPEFRQDISTHFYHKVEMLHLLQREFDLFLVVERGDIPEGFKNAYVQYFRWLPLRAVELFSILLALRLLGYRRFWTHYSFVAANLTPFFGKGFYWNCGMPWLYRRRRFEEMLFRRSMKKNTLAVGTEGMKQTYAKEYLLNPRRIAVVPNGINLERYIPWRSRRTEARTQLGITQDQRVVLFAHHLSRRKGAHRIKPISEHFLNDPSVVFMVAGSGPDAHMVTGGNIRRVGDIPQETIPLYLAAADIFFMPSEEEGAPHVILEAMAIGLPIVASDVGGVKEMIPPGLEPYILSGDDALFAEKLKVLLEDEGLRGRLSEEEKEWIVRYDMKEIIPRFVEAVSEKQA